MATLNLSLAMKMTLMMPIKNYNNTLLDTTTKQVL